MARKNLNNADLAWLRLDRPENPLVITGLMILSAPIDYEQLTARIIETFTPFKRFQQRLVQPNKPLHRAYWEDDATFRFDNHIEKIDLPYPGDQSALERFISHLISTQMDFSRPLWHIYFIPSFEAGSAIIARIHHTIIDGISLMQVISLALNETPVPDPHSISLGAKLMARSRRKHRQGLKENARSFFSCPGYARRKIRDAVIFLSEAIRILMMPADPATPLKGDLGSEKRAVWSQPIAMQLLRDIGKPTSSTTNEVMTACIAGALSQYLTLTGFAVRNLAIRAIVLVNLRPLELDKELGNKFGFYFLDIPLWIDDGFERLNLIKQKMDALKASPLAKVTFAIFRILGSLPAWLERAAMHFFDRKGSLVITNVPGYKRQLYLVGSPVYSITTMVPHSSQIGLGFSIVSYNDYAILGITSDAGVIPNPELLLAAFYQELERFSRHLEA
jgi:diacylglycerol O-acyltransferase / wax synthase